MTPDTAELRGRGIITTILLILLAALIVRDILARRWAGPAAAPGVTSPSSPGVTSPSSPGVTSRSSCDSERLTTPAPRREV
jgi:hypothetical protein